MVVTFGCTKLPKPQGVTKNGCYKDHHGGSKRGFGFKVEDCKLHGLGLLGFKLRIQGYCTVLVYDFRV